MIILGIIGKILIKKHNCKLVSKYYYLKYFIALNMAKPNTLQKMVSLQTFYMIIFEDIIIRVFA